MGKPKSLHLEASPALGRAGLALEGPGGEAPPPPPTPSTCLKSQVVDLKAEGYWEELMDTTRPDIQVKDW